MGPKYKDIEDDDDEFVTNIKPNLAEFEGNLFSSAVVRMRRKSIATRNINILG